MKTLLVVSLLILASVGVYSYSCNRMPRPHCFEDSFMIVDADKPMCRNYDSGKLYDPEYFTPTELAKYNGGQHE